MVQNERRDPSHPSVQPDGDPKREPESPARPGVRFESVTSGLKERLWASISSLFKSDEQKAGPRTDRADEAGTHLEIASAEQSDREPEWSPTPPLLLESTLQEWRAYLSLQADIYRRYCQDQEGSAVRLQQCRARTSFEDTVPGQIENAKNDHAMQLIESEMDQRFGVFLEEINALRSRIDYPPLTDTYYARSSYKGKYHLPRPGYIDHSFAASDYSMSSSQVADILRIREYDTVRKEGTLLLETKVDERDHQRNGARLLYILNDQCIVMYGAEREEYTTTSYAEAGETTTGTGKWGPWGYQFASTSPSRFSESELNVAAAFEFARQRHQGQVRDGEEQIPYITHPVGVAAIVRKAEGSQAAVCASILHDTMEDCSATEEEIERLFASPGLGRRVAGIVAELTDPKGLPYSEKKQRQIELMKSGYSDDAALVRAADQIANLTDLVSNPPRWGNGEEQEYIESIKKLIDARADLSPALREQFQTAYRNACDSYGVAP